MVARIHYNNIKHLTLEPVVEQFRSFPKGLVKELLVGDLISEYYLRQPVADTMFRDVFPAGAYLFFDPEGHIRYIGQSHQGFFNRLMSQLDVTPGGGWGWNALLRKMGGERNSKAHHELTEDDHWDDFETLQEYQLLLVDIDRNEINPNQLQWLEKYLLKTFRVINGERLLNTLVGGLYEEDWEKTLDELLST